MSDTVITINPAEFNGLPLFKSVSIFDVEDGAARLYDPIARGVAGAPIHSVLLKDYAAVPW